MSRFLLLVVLPKETKAEDREATVSRLMAPYSDHEVAEYQQACFCVGRAAERRAEQLAAAQHGSLQELLDKFDGSYPDQADSPLSGPAWLAWDRLVEPYRTTERAAFWAQPDRDVPDAACPVCRGLGRYSTTANPTGRWDYCSVMDRDEAGNAESDEMGARFVEDVLDHLQDDVVTPFFALLTPDGEWRDHWGGRRRQVHLHEKSCDAWRDEVRTLLKPYVGCPVVIVACHT